MARLSTLFLVLSILVGSAATAAETPTYTAPKVAQAPALDGRLDDAAWAAAPVLSGMLTSRERKPSGFPTEWRLVYDDQALYVATAAEEPHVDRLVINEGSTNLWWDDCVEVFLDPQATRARYYQFLINAAGAVDSGYTGDFAADVPAETAVGRDGNAWTLEVRIPFTTFGAAPHLGERWGLNVTRARNGKEPDEEREVSLWSPTDGMHGSPGRFGSLVFGPEPGKQPPREQPDPQTIARVLKRIEDELAGRWRWTPEDVSFEAADERATRLLALLGLLARFPDTRLLPYVRPAIVDDQIRPWTVPARDELGKSIELVACRGEFESASLGVFAAQELKSVRLECSDLVGARGAVLSATVADPYHVICWYQGGVGSVHRGRTTLLPELLMKDPTLVGIDTKKRENRLSFDPQPRDAGALQPIDIPAFESRQLWIRFRIPDDARPGRYSGQIVLSSADGSNETVPVRITVPRWRLAQSPMLHGLYYGRRIPRIETVEEERAFWDTVEQELRDQIEHGCNVVATYIHTTTTVSDPSPTATAQRISDIQKKYGVTGTPYFGVVDHVGFQQGDQLPAVTERARLLDQWARANDRDGFCFQGRDEASGKGLLEQRPSWEACRAGGGKMWVATRPSYFEHMGDLLDFPVVTGRLDPELAQKVHANGFRILSYGNPQAGVEMPEVYRRSYGLALRAGGYDGSINFTYMTIEPKEGWDDFDEESYRDHNFSYPAESKPVSTVQFAGWREGIDDVRYAATLEGAIARALERNSNDAFAQRSKAWLDGVTGYEEDLDAVRAQMVRTIDRLTVQGGERRARGAARERGGRR